MASLPEGIYGFTTSAATSEIATFDKPVFRSFEVHKLQGGETVFVGYMNEADLNAFAEGAEPVTVDLYPDPWESATHLAMAPASRIDKKRPPQRDFGSPMKLEIAAKF